MATIKSTIMLQDKMSPVFKSIAKSINLTVAAMRSVDSVGGRAFSDMKGDVNAAKAAMDGLNSETAELPAHAKRAAASFGGMEGQLIKAGAAVYAIKAGLTGLGKATDMLDNLSIMKARADLVNRSFGTTVDIQKKAFNASQRSRTSYIETFDTIGKLGIQAPDAFSSSEEIVAFVELTNKAFKASGTGTQQQAAATMQLTQALASGKLQGEEFSSVLENAPLIAQAIAKYTGRTIGQLKKDSSDGAITTRTILNSVYSYADEINALFNGLPITVQDSMQKIKDNITRALEPIADKLSALVQTEKFQGIIEKFIDWIILMMDRIGAFFDYVITNWDKIVKVLEPGLWALVAVFGAVKFAGMLMNRELLLMQIKMIALVGLVALAIYAWENWGVAGKVLAVVLGAIAAALLLCTIQQKKFNLAVLMNPMGITLIVIIGIIALVIAAMYFWKDETVKVFEFLGGWCGWMVAMWHNMVAGIWNQLASLIEFFANCWTDPLRSVARLFAGFADSTLLMIQTIATAIDAVFGTKLAAGVENFRNTLKSWTKDTFGEGNFKLERMKEMDGATAIAAGVKKGNEVGNAAADGVKSMVDAAKKLSEKSNEGIARYKDVPGEDVSKYIKDIGTLELGGGSIDEIGKIKDDVSITEEDIKLLKDVASAEFVNRYTTLRPEMTVTFGDVHESADVGGILETIEVMVEEAYASALVTV